MTKEIFFKNLAYLKETYPHSTWIAQIKQEYNIINVTYLRKALEVEESKLTQTKTNVVLDEIELNKLYIKKSKLFADRAKLSNKMIALPDVDKYDNERANISLQINTIQNKIENIFNEIEYTNHKDKKAKKEPRLSLDSLLKRQKSIPVQKSKIKSKIKNEKNEDTKKLLKKQFDDLCNELKDVNERVKKFQN